MVTQLDYIPQTTLLGVVTWPSSSKGNVNGSNVCYQTPGPSKTPCSVLLLWIDVHMHGSHLLNMEGSWVSKQLLRRELPTDWEHMLWT